MFFLLPLIGAAVGATIGAIIADDWAESDRAEARHYRQMENALTSKYSDLQKQYYEIADKSKELAEEQNKKLAAMSLENSYLDLALELSCSLFVLSQDISKNPSYKSLIQFREAVQQTNQVLLKLNKQPIYISQDYFAKNFAEIERRKVIDVKSEHFNNNDVRNLEVEYRKILAADENASSELLFRLATDRSSEVRRLVAKHPNTSVEVLEKLAKSKNMEIKASAKNSLRQRHLQ
jgi:gas vesicle protein